MPRTACVKEDPLDGLSFKFQPILAADGERVLAYETLARRSRRDGTVEGPASFLPEAMCPSRIERFTEESLEFALSTLQADPLLPGLSVNLSPRQAELAITGSVIASAPLSSRRRLLIELTEDSIAEHPALSGVLRGLASLGVRIFLDDIDARWRQRCAVLGGVVHGLKIDRALLQILAAEPIDRNCRALIDFAQESGLQLVAEGVEDAGVLPGLAARGISFFQGFALGEPWSEPAVARRHILAPGNDSILSEKQEGGAVSVLSGKSYSGC